MYTRGWAVDQPTILLGYESYISKSYASLRADMRKDALKSEDDTPPTTSLPITKLIGSQEILYIMRVLAMLLPTPMVENRTCPWLGFVKATEP